MVKRDLIPLLAFILFTLYFSPELLARTTLALTAGAMPLLKAPVFLVLGTRVSQARVNLIQSDSRTGRHVCQKNRRHNPDQSHNVITPVKGHALAAKTGGTTLTKATI